MLTRRGFLQTILSAGAAVGAAAVLDPISKLWVPAPPAPLFLATPEMVTASRWLNDLALDVAKAMAWRLDRPEVLSISGVAFKAVPGLHTQVLEVPGVGTKHLLPADRCVRFLEEPRGLGDVALATHLANELRIAALPLQVFVPITPELRPGEPFTDDVEIGVGTDPQSGLSVRVLRFEHERRKGRLEPMLAVEMAGGTWLAPGAGVPSTHTLPKWQRQGTYNDLFRKG